MSTTTVLCAYCESLPERVPGRTARIIRCPLCKTNLEVTPAGAKFRVSAEAAPDASRWRRWTARALGLGACFAAVLGLIAAARSTAPRETPDQPAASSPAPPAVVRASLTRPSEPPAVVVQPVVKAAASPYFPPGEIKAAPYVRKHRALVPKNAPVRAAAPEVLSVTTVLARAAAPEPDWTSELLKVPEVDLHTPPQRPISKEAARKAITDTTALARERDKKTQDGFIRSLQKERDNLAGLPFLLGDKCRLEASAAHVFRTAVVGLRGAGAGRDAAGASRMNRPFNVAAFWQAWTSPYYASSRSRSQPSAAPPEARAAHGVAAMTQILGPANQETRLALVEVLRGIEHPKADDALIKAVLYDVDVEVREQALLGLISRPSQGPLKANLKKLAEGLKHPWPVVAERAAKALVALGGEEAAPLLNDFLKEPDPAAPFVIEREGTKRLAVREVVRINHHRNCQLCHAPVEQPAGVAEQLEPGLVGVVPSLAEPLPPIQYYPSGLRDFDMGIRADVTYLRQDFSVTLPVEDSGPWPKAQRFDFLVRTRVLHDSEAAALRDRPPLSPQHQAALAALRELTGADFGWRAVGRQMPGARGGPMPSAPTAWAALPQAPPRAEVVLRAAD
jgi:hypothetical protein